MKRYRSNALQILAVIAMFLFFPQFLKAERPESAMSGRLVDLALHIEHQIELAQINVQRGTLDQGLLKRQAEEAAKALEGLEGQIHSLAEDNREALLLKLESVKSQAENLALAAELGSSPSRHTNDDSLVKHLGRGGQPQSAPSNDDCEAAFVVGFGSYYGDTTDAGNDGEAICGSSLYSPDVWYRFVAQEYGRVAVETIGSSFDTVLSVHSGCPGTMNNQSLCNDDYLGVQSVVGFTAYSGSEYLIRVAGSNGATGSYVLTISEGGGIEGTVIETETGLPISTMIEVFDDASYQVGQDYTDSSGTYNVENLSSGNYFVATDGSPDAVNELYDNVPCPGGVPSGCDVTTGEAVPVVAGGLTGGIDFGLDRGGEITGIVLEEATGLPISGARVRLYDAGGSYQTYSYSDLSGVYVFGGLSEGGYYLVANSSFYRYQLYDSVPCPGGLPDGCSLGEGAVVDVTLNGTISGIDFALEELGAIEGTVRDRATNLPISSANVRIYDISDIFYGSGNTDSTGAYRIGGLGDGTYYVRASLGYGYVPQFFDGVDCLTNCQASNGTPVVISNQTSVTGIDFNLTTSGIIEGRVIDSKSLMPISGVMAIAYDQLGRTVDYDYTDSAGIYQLDGCDAGTYFVVVRDNEYIDEIYDDIPCPDICYPTAGTPVLVSYGQTTAGIDFSISAKGKVTGSVTAVDGGEGVTMRVRLYDSLGTYLTYDDSYGGVYEFAGLETGEYFVVADYYSSQHPYLDQIYDGIECWGGPPEGCVVTDGTPVNIVTAEVTSGIDFQLKQRSTISGVVMDAADGSLLIGYVSVREVNGPGHWSDYFSGGAYSVGGLIPGDYLVIADTNFHVAEAWQDFLCEGEFPNDCDLSGATPVSLGTASETEINFALQRLGTVSGTVRSATDGSPLRGYFVKAYDSSGEWIASDSTDASGEYDFNGLWPGTLFVVTDERDQGFVDQLYSGIDCPLGPPEGCDPTTGTGLSVDINTSYHNIDFNLPPTGSISGQVIDGVTGMPIPRVMVKGWDAEGNYVNFVETDSFGSYEIRGLWGGTFFVATDEFTTNGSHVDFLFEGIPCPTGPPNGCDVTKGTPVPVVLGAVTRFIDFVLPRRVNGISGMVSDVLTGEPIADVYVDFWNVDSEAYELGVRTSPAGTFIADFDEGNFVAATYSSGDWINQVWDGIECPGGSGYDGDCDPMTGTVISVGENELISNINFLLQSAPFFGDGFESGDTTLWSATLP